jgi:hypothetical protein
MSSLRLFPSLALCLFLAAAFALVARGDEVTSTLKFSQPDQPGTVRIQLARGSLSVRGADVAEVTVKSDTAPAAKSPRRDGLRVLTSSSSFAFTEKDNVITLDASSDGSGSRATRFEVTVPRQTAVVVQNSWGGEIRCTGLVGDLEITNLNGAIRLEEVSGGVVASTMNGEIHASVRELREGKPLSFQSMNGEIVVRLVGDAKANVRVRTQNGSVLTDFDEAALVTRTEAAPLAAASRTHMVVHTQTLLAPEAREAIREAARVGAEAAREAATAIREAVEAAREGAEAARARSSGTSHTAVAVAPPAPPSAPRAPRPPKAVTIPTITGGKLVSGTLNGGGPEISIATMNGDVTLRRLDRK